MKSNSDLEDELRSEYDLKSLKVRKLGSGRKKFGEAVVRLEPDVAEMFPSAESVNEALRFLIKITRENQLSASSKQPNNAVKTDS